MSDYQYIYKIIVIGDSGVGKTNIVTRLVHNEFSKELKSTIGVEFFTKLFELNDLSRTKIIAQIWDTTGQEKFRAITSAYFRGAVGALLVFDLNNPITFQNLFKWYLDLKNANNTKMICIVIGNKSDLQRNVSENDITDFCQVNELYYLETSALNNTNIDQAFKLLIKKIYESQEQQKEFEEVKFDSPTIKQGYVLKSNNNKRIQNNKCEC